MLIIGDSEFSEAGDAGRVIAQAQTDPSVARSSTDCAAQDAQQVPAAGSLYVLQCEMAVVSPKVAAVVGSGASTTCAIVLLWDSATKLCTVAHLDGSDTEGTLRAMLEPHDPTHALQLHLGGSYADENGKGAELLLEILQPLLLAPARVILMTACVGAVNTVPGAHTGGRYTHARPRQTAFALDLHSGTFFPAAFESRGPMHELRSLRFMRCGAPDRYPNVIDSKSGCFVIQPFQYERFAEDVIKMGITCSDARLLQMLSTSPHCEPPEFCDDLRGAFRFMLTNPQFPGPEPLQFVCSPDGEWVPAPKH